MLAGRYFRAIQLTPGQNPPHELDIAADSAAALAITPDTELALHNLVMEAGALFGSRHYRDYHFLLTLSDDVAHFGLEHHESSDDRTSERSLIDDAERWNSRRCCRTNSCTPGMENIAGRPDLRRLTISSR